MFPRLRVSESQPASENAILSTRTPGITPRTLSGTLARAAARIIAMVAAPREARRATLDALPLLKKAARVTVVEVAHDSHLAEARSVDWMLQHQRALKVLRAVQPAG